MEEMDRKDSLAVEEASLGVTHPVPGKVKLTR